MICIMGIDPGISGAVAFYFPDSGRVSVHDMPVADGRVNGASIAAMIAQMNPDYAVLELVGAMPGQGVSSMFNFGTSFGIVIGVIAACNVRNHLVTPAKWKKHFRLSADKEASRALALRMFPANAEHFARKKDNGRAEAALLALYGYDAALFGPSKNTRVREGEGVAGVPGS